MNANRPELDAISNRIIGCAFTVANALGSGFLEKVYENALAVELRMVGLAVEQQRGITVTYKGILVGEYFVDLLVEEDRYAWPGPVRIALLPGSRERAYADAERIADIAVLAMPPAVTGRELAFAQECAVADVYTDVASVKVLPARQAREPQRQVFAHAGSK